MVVDSVNSVLRWKRSRFFVFRGSSALCSLVVESGMEQRFGGSPELRRLMSERIHCRGVCNWLQRKLELPPAEVRYEEAGLSCLAWVLPGGSPFPVEGWHGHTINRFALREPTMLQSKNILMLPYLRTPQRTTSLRSAPFPILAH